MSKPTPDVSGIWSLWKWKKWSRKPFWGSWRSATCLKNPIIASSDLLWLDSPSSIIKFARWLGFWLRYFQNNFMGLRLSARLFSQSSMTYILRLERDFTWIGWPLSLTTIEVTQNRKLNSLLKKKKELKTIELICSLKLSSTKSKVKFSLNGWRKGNSGRIKKRMKNNKASQNKTKRRQTVTSKSR